MTMLLPQQHQCGLRKPKFPSKKKMMQNPRDGGSYRYPNTNPGYTPRGLYHSCLTAHHPLLPPGALNSKCTGWSAASSTESGEAKGMHSRVYRGRNGPYTHTSLHQVLMSRLAFFRCQEWCTTIKSASPNGLLRQPLMTKFYFIFLKEMADTE